MGSVFELAHLGAFKLKLFDTVPADTSYITSSLLIGTNGKCDALRHRVQNLAERLFEQEMTMLQLIFSVCSIIEGASCHELPPMTLQENTTMIACLMASQIEGAKWVATHPNQYIQKATCEPAGHFAKL